MSALRSLASCWQDAIKRLALVLKVSPLIFCWCKVQCAHTHIRKGGGGISSSWLLGLAERSSAILAIKCASQGGGGEDRTRAILAQVSDFRRPPTLAVMIASTTRLYLRGAEFLRSVRTRLGAAVT